MDAKSLSARRAWIEIQAATILGEVVESLSARRAWIEIHHVLASAPPVPPSLSARRAWIEMPAPYGEGSAAPGRSPQGERG